METGKTKRAKLTPLVRARHQQMRATSVIVTPMMSNCFHFGPLGLLDSERLERSSEIVLWDGMRNKDPMARGMIARAKKRN